MTNAMDRIVIRFGETKITAEERIRIESAKKQLKNMEALGAMSNIGLFKQRKKDLKKIIAQDTGCQEMNLLDFLKTDASQLPEKEQQVQKLLAFLYDLNEKTPPVFKKFPIRDKSLVIDCTTISFEGTGGVYNNNANTIFMCDSNYNDKQLLEVLAHELKHAEHWVDMQNYNTYQIHQLNFLKEAQADICGKWVKREFSYTNKNENEEQTDEYSAINKLLLALFDNQSNVDNFVYGSLASEDMPYHLENFFNNTRLYGIYKDDYDEKLPISYKDKGLTRIPAVFGIEKQDEVKILKILNKRVPKKARTPDNLLIQAMHNDDAQTIKKLLLMKDETGAYFVSNQSVLNLLSLACYKNADIYQATQQSGRMTKEDYQDLLGSVLHFPEHEICTPKEMKERQKIFADLISQKDEKGCFILPDDEINEQLAYTEIMESEEALPLLKYAKTAIAKARPVLLQKIKESNSR